ncbi:MAG: rhomboid family intramembrane serine protease [Gemmatimonadota bacterium]|nr:rhomboid family intramembrane serine protease [Gemmatimonadota bacterium]
MFPLRDDNPTELTPFITIALIALNVIGWFVIQGMGVGNAFVGSICQYGAIPGEITGAIAPGTPVDVGPGLSCRVGGLRWETALTSMFLHTGWMHLIGNMWFLWVFGNNIEDSMGHLRFIVFYGLCGVVAVAVHVLTDPGSTVPVVGASGAISGIMGAYLLLYPRVRIHTLFIIIIVIRVIPVAAWVMLGYWFLLQLASGAATLGATGGGVAFWAHVGGFVAGLALIKPFERRPLVEAKLAGRRLSREEVRELGWF